MEKKRKNGYLRKTYAYRSEIVLKDLFKDLAGP